MFFPATAAGDFAGCVLAAGNNRLLKFVGGLGCRDRSAVTAVPFVADDLAETIIGEVTQHPTNPSIWGLRNLSSTPWVATSPDGSAKEVPPQKATSLEAGLKLNVAGVVAEVQP